MKGISPFLATVLLIGIVLVVAMIATNWFTEITKDTTDTAGNKTREATKCASAGILIRDVYVDSTNSLARVVISNAGQADNLNVVSITIFNSTGHSNQTTGDPDLDRGEINSTQVDLPFTTCPGSFNKVIVTTDCGGISDEFDSSTGDQPTCV